MEAAAAPALPRPEAGGPLRGCSPVFCVCWPVDRFVLLTDVREARTLGERPTEHSAATQPRLQPPTTALWQASLHAVHPAPQWTIPLQTVRAKEQASNRPENQLRRFLCTVACSAQVVGDSQHPAGSYPSAVTWAR